MRKRIVWLLVSCLMVAALLLASCAPAVTEEEEAVAPPPEKEKVAPAKPTPKPTGPQYGGTLTIVKTTSPVHFDPMWGATESAETESFWVEQLGMIDWLTDRDEYPFFGYAPLEYVTGGLAESWETPDNLTIVFHIRKGVYWQDKPPVNGREFTAYDVEFTYHRGYGLGSGFTEPQGAVALLPQVGPGSIESVTATDKYTVVFKLKEPSIEALRAYLVDNYALMIVAREAVEAYGDLEDWRSAVGTGPFILVDHVPDSSLTFRKNPNYWGWDENHPENKLPYVDEISMLIIVDQNTALAGLRSGKVDEINYSLLNPLLTWEQAAMLTETNPEIRQIAVPGAFSVGIGMAQASGPFSDVKVRTALQMAIDLPAIAKTYYGGSIEPHPWGIVGVPALYTPYDQWPEAIKEEYTYNPEKARQLLAEAGYPNGFKTDYLFPAGRDVDLMQIVQSYFADIGVDMEIKVMEYGAWYGAVVGKPAAGTMFWQFNGFTWAPVSLGLAWQLSGSLLNFGQAHDDVYDELSYKAAAALDYEEWKRSIIEANDRGIARHLVLSLLRPTTFAVYQPWLKGISGEREMGTSNIGPIYARLWIDQELKKAMGH